MGQCHARLCKLNVRAMPKQRRAEQPKIMPDNAFQVGRDWVSDARTNVLAWWAPKGAMVAALFAPVPVRAVVWAAALVWMGTACIFNAQRCGRTHCRYTGPFYLAMIVPVVLFATNIIPANFYGWLALAVLILPGGWIIGGPLSEHGASSHSADVRFWPLADISFCTANVRFRG